MAVGPAMGLPGVPPPGLADAPVPPRPEGVPDGVSGGVSGGDGPFGLHFSKHAARRIEQRGLELDQVRLQRLERAVGQAEAKGARDSLILLDELALVVSVQNRTVVTAVDEASRKEHVFTNIDSVVIAP